MWIGFKLWWKGGYRLSTVGFDLVELLLGLRHVIIICWFICTNTRDTEGSLLHVTEIMAQIMGGSGRGNLNFQRGGGPGERCFVVVYWGKKIRLFPKSMEVTAFGGHGAGANTLCKFLTSKKGHVASRDDE